MNKFIYLHVVQGYYGQGWEDVAASEDRREARSDLKAYLTNCTYPYRIIRRREPNPQHAGGE